MLLVPQGILSLAICSDMLIESKTPLKALSLLSKPLNSLISPFLLKVEKVTLSDVFRSCLGDVLSEDISALGTVSLLTGMACRLPSLESGVSSGWVLVCVTVGSLMVDKFSFCLFLGLCV